MKRIPAALLLVLGVVLLCATPEAMAAQGWPWVGDSTLRTSLLSIEDYIVCLRATPASNGVLDSITVYLDGTGPGGEDLFTIQYAIYNYNGGTPTPKIDSVAPFNLNMAIYSDAWVSQPTVIDATISSGTTYDICAWANLQLTDNLSIRVNSGQTGIYIEYQSITYGTSWPTTLTETSLSNYSMSIYAVYHTAPAGGGNPRRRRILGQIGGVGFDLPADSVPASFWSAQ